MPSNFQTATNVQNSQQLSANPGDDAFSKKGNIIKATESKIEELTLLKTDKDGNPIQFKILPWDATVSTTSPLSSIGFKESMFNGCIFGSLVVFDIRNWIDEFLFTGNEKLNIKFKIRWDDINKKPFSTSFL